MKEDVPSNYQSGKLPILDLEVWVQGNRIYHQFYKKPMASRMVVQAESAFSTANKRSILIEEGLRRLRNCSPELDWSEKVRFLNRFSSDMKRSGHVTSFRRTILSRVIMKYRMTCPTIWKRKSVYTEQELREITRTMEPKKRNKPGLGAVVLPVH